MKIQHARGFTLVELMVTVSIMLILGSLAGPAFMQWIRDTHLRNQTEAVMYGLQAARGQAIQRNAVVRFQLVTSNGTGTISDNTCRLTTTSNFWVVSHGDPTGQCGLAESLQAPVPPIANDAYNVGPAGTPPVLLLKNARESGTTAPQTTLSVAATGVATPDNILCFDGSGRLQRLDIATGLCTSSTNPGTTAQPQVQIDVTDAIAGACRPPLGTGSSRCLRVQATTTGEVRMCDPSVDTTDTNDPRRCS